MLNDVYNLPGPDFLLLYGVAGGIVILLVTALFLVARFWVGPREGASLELSALEAAYLMGSKAHVFNTAMAELVSTGHLQIWNHRFSPGPMAGTTVHSDDPQQQAIYATLLARASHHGGAGVALDVMRATIRKHASFRARLSRRGLMLGWAGAKTYFATVTLCFGLLFAFAVPKVVIGLARDRPVVGLLIAMAMVLGAGWVFCVYPHRTVAGREALNELKRRHPCKPGAASIGLLTALYGVGVVPMFAATINYHAVQARHDHDNTGGCGGGCGDGCGGCGD